MDTVASRDVPPPVLEFDGGISLVIAVKMPRSHEIHVQNHWVIARYAVRARTILEPYGIALDRKLSFLIDCKRPLDSRADPMDLVRNLMGRTQATCWLRTARQIDHVGVSKPVRPHGPVWILQTP